MKKILKDLIGTMTLPEDSYLDQDAEILEIFVEELEEVFTDLETLIGQWIQQPQQQDHLVAIRRYFHTLKGSGRMVGAKSSGELAWTVEDLLNRVIAKSVELTPQIMHYVQTVFKIYQYKLFSQFQNSQPHTIDLRPLVLLGQHLQQQTVPEPALSELLALGQTLDSNEAVTGLEWSNIEPDLQPAESDESIQTVTHAQEHELLVTEALPIFLEEAEEHLATIDEFLQQDNIEGCNYNALIRALHTLRGSSAMADVEHIFEASSKVEGLFKTLLQDELASTSNETALLTHYAEFVRDYLYTLKQAGSPEQLQQLYQKFSHAWENYGFHLEPSEHMVNPQGLVSALLKLNIDQLLDAEFEFDQQVRNNPNYLPALIEQAQELVKHTDNRAAQGLHDFSLELIQDYQELLSKPALLNMDYAYELFAQAHQQFIYLFDTLAAGQRVSLSADQQRLLNELSAFVQQDNTVQEPDAKEATLAPVMLQNQPLAEQAAPEHGMDLAALSARIRSDQQLLGSAASHQVLDADLRDIFLEEAEELLVGMDSDLSNWAQQKDHSTALNNLMRYLHTLKGGANMLQASHIGLIAHELESIYERIIQGQIQATPTLIKIIHLVQDDLAERIQTLREQYIDYPAPETIALLKDIEVISRTTAGTGAAETSAAPLTQQTVVQEAAVTRTPAQDHYAGSEAEVMPKRIGKAQGDDQVRSIAEEAFLEEAEELLEAAQQLLAQWIDERSNRSLLLQLQRNAHSLKGGARMTELEPVAEIAYALENAFEQFGLHNLTTSVYDSLLKAALQWLTQAIYHAQFDGYERLKQNLESIQATAPVSPAGLAIVDRLPDAGLYEFVQGDGTEPPSMLGEWNTEQQSENSEMIRISADLVEKMIDLTGENSINRSRIEMDLGQLGSTLSDMELAIRRLADQLRRMEGELESQIIAKHGTENSRYTDFDPLEMDQYSALNQLSKSLAESTSDLLDFKTTLAEKIRDSEGLLLQQSRIQAELQETLMRTRLVPFSRLLPRLQRIARQTSSALNRPAELIVHNTEGELDRTILERLISPLEHMLRNAIDHGIEGPEQRVQLGKPETGRIELNVSRQGTDVIITFTDDGRGIDTEKLQAKALARGLIQAGQVLERPELSQLIFHPGLSTAAEVTQISGRGVGLDVVQTDIKAMGGHVSVESVAGKGTTFIIRVPTTVAVSDALMVKAGDQQYAVPLAQIERIVRIAPSALEEYFNGKDDYFRIDNLHYKLRYLSEFIANQPLPRLNGIAHSLPVLLIKSNSGQTIALLVDQLIGSRAQIVVKPVGQQLASVGTVAGATILGDGQVCLILDGQYIARQVQASARIQDTAEHRELHRLHDERRLIMIVDDSVTVRKVTSRLLERQGYDVVTAKDGIEAIELLETVKPDLMLLDIEMPRMDGFEVTNLVRHHDIHQAMPIIMITSRTGEKHRERAFALGATQYMGKPFQEAELLANIETLLDVTV